MCGLIYFHSELARSVAKPILKRYHLQKSRGNEGFGFVSLSLKDKALSYFTRKAEEKDILSCLSTIRNGGTEGQETNAILFHHRHPTSTPNFQECAHPICVRNEKLDHIYFLAHNGVIWNPEELKAKHEKDGFKYNTEIKKQTVWKTSEASEYIEDEESQFNDSESLAIEMALYADGKSKTVNMRGSMAFIMIQCTPDMKATKLFWGRNTGSPLFIEKNANHFCLKSEGKYPDNVLVDKLYCYNYETKEETFEPLEFETAYGNGYGRRSTPTTSPAEMLPMGFQFPKNADKPGEEGDKDKQTKIEVKHLPRQNFADYMEESSQIDYALDDLLMEGASLVDIEEETSTEVDIVEDLINFEIWLNRMENVELLKERKRFLEDRVVDIWKRIDAIKTIEEAEYGIDDYTEYLPKGYDLKRDREEMSS